MSFFIYPHELLTQSENIFTTISRFSVSWLFLLRSGVFFVTYLVLVCCEKARRVWGFILLGYVSYKCALNNLEKCPFLSQETVPSEFGPSVHIRKCLNRTETQAVRPSERFSCAHFNTYTRLPEKRRTTQPKYLLPWMAALFFSSPVNECRRWNVHG